MKFFLLIAGVIALMCYFTSGVSGSTGVDIMSDCKEGEVTYDVGCVKRTCGKDGTLTSDGCGPVSCGGEGVRKVADLSKNYPKCCPTCVFDKN